VVGCEELRPPACAAAAGVMRGSTAVPPRAPRAPPIVMPRSPTARAATARPASRVAAAADAVAPRGLVGVPDGPAPRGPAAPLGLLALEPPGAADEPGLADGDVFEAAPELEPEAPPV